MSHRSTGARRPWGWLAAALAVVAATCLAVAVQGGSPAALGAAVPAEPVAPVAPVTPVERSHTSPAPRRIPPVGLSIPVIDVDARIAGVALNPDRTVEVPSDPWLTGWYRLGPAPGSSGSAVILGHVDSPAGPAVFARLRYLVRGDLVHVEGADGSTATFRVTRVATYPNQSFPAQEVYAAPGPGRRLRLVTCGGAYEPGDGYQANVVVYTRLVRGA
jgi:hypothetical protein